MRSKCRGRNRSASSSNYLFSEEICGLRERVRYIPRAETADQKQAYAWTKYVYSSGWGIANPQGNGEPETSPYRWPFRTRASWRDVKNKKITVIVVNCMRNVNEKRNVGRAELERECQEKTRG